jgi:hypothetical protein
MKTMLTFSCAGLAAYLSEGCAGAPSVGLALPDLSAHQWQHRVLVIDTPSRQSGDYLQQNVALEAVSAGLQERDLRIVTQTGATVFRVRLIGKDGGVKLDRSAPVDAPTLFALIDAMPMRRAEMTGR